MPDFSTDVDIDPDDYVSECSTREKIQLIDIIVEECADDSELKQTLLKSIKEHFPQSSTEILSDVRDPRGSFMYNGYIDSLIKLSEAYYRLSNEDIEKINELAKRF